MPGSDSAWLSAVVALLVVLLLVVVLRRVWLVQACRGIPGTLRRPSGSSVRGLLVYSRTGLRWYRALSLSPLPSGRWPRRGFTLVDVSRLVVDGTESDELSVVAFMVDGQEYELIMGTSAAAGLSSWYEGRPPFIVEYFG